MTGIKSEPRRDSFDHIPPLPRKHVHWDAADVLEIINPSRGYLTCVGYAPSRRRRCQNPINQSNRSFAYQILEELSQTDVSKTNVNDMLRQLARSTLCLRYHQGQVDSVVQGWSRRIDQQRGSTMKQESPARDYPRPRGYQSRTHGATQPPSYEPSHKDFTDIKRQLAEIQEYLEQMRQKSKREERRPEEAGEKERNKAHEERRRRREDEDKQRRREEEERQQRREDEERQRRRQEEEKQQKREEEKAKARKAREEEERRERIRQNAKRAKEERERKEKERAERERREWDNAWTCYVQGWEELKKKETRGTSEQLRAIIPWPVKSANDKDVSEKEVESFFRNAPPRDYDHRKKLALFTKECLKWHADRLPRTFGNIEDEALKTLFHTVSQVVIKMRAEVAR